MSDPRDTGPDATGAEKTQQAQWGNIRQWQETGFRAQSELLKVAVQDWVKGLAHPWDGLLGVIYGTEGGMTEAEGIELRQSLDTALFARYQNDTIYANNDPETDYQLDPDDNTPRWRTTFDEQQDGQRILINEDRLALYVDVYIGTGKQVEYPKDPAFQASIDRGVTATPARRR